MSEKGEQKRIMAFGTFDGLHRGHLHFFKQARKLSKNPFLIVSVARDKNVKRIKGELPFHSEKERLQLIKNCPLVDQAVLSGVSDHIPHIIRQRPDILVLGYDQKAYVKNLKKDLIKKGVSVRVVRLKPYKADIYKNNLLKK